MKVLHLTLKKKWFDMIASGEKKEEYREIKDFWAKRLLYKIGVPWGGCLSPKADIIKGDYEASGWKSFTRGAPIFEDFSQVKFARGGHFHPDLPQMTLENKGIRIGEGKPEWGAEPGKKYFVISLGEIIK